jgi:lipopolysaccharide export system protein LptA
MVYATRDGSLELEKDVVVQLQPRIDHASDPALRLTASRLRYDKLRRQIMLWGPIRVTQGERNVSADSGKVFLNEASRVTRSEAGRTLG